MEFWRRFVGDSHTGSALSEYLANGHYVRRWFWPASPACAEERARFDKVVAEVVLGETTAESTFFYIEP